MNFNQLRQLWIFLNQPLFSKSASSKAHDSLPQAASIKNSKVSHQSLQHWETVQYLERCLRLNYPVDHS